MAEPHPRAVPFGLNIDTALHILATLATHPACGLTAVMLCLAHPAPAFLRYAVALAAAQLAATIYRLQGGQGDRIDWSSQTVLITGGSRGLGYETVRVLLENRGVRIVVFDILEFPTPHPPNVHFYQCDLAHRDPQQLADLVDQAIAEVGPITALISNAGAVSMHPLREHSVASIERVVNVNLRAPMVLASRCCSQQTQCYVVFIASALAFIGVRHLSSYTATKAGVAMLYESARLEGIPCCVIVPSKIRTAMFGRVRVPAWLSPELEPRAVARAVVECVAGSVVGEVYLPAFARLVPFYFGVHRWIRDCAQWVAGSLESVERAGY